MGHARAILMVDQPALQLKLYNETIKKSLSVRQVEALAKQYQEGEIDAETASSTPAKRLNSSEYKILERHLSSAFSTAVKFSCDVNGKGKITFPFKNEAELERLITIFDKLKNEDSQKS
jgi:ParB family chromosome partitioning protein